MSCLPILSTSAIKKFFDQAGDSLESSQRRFGFSSKNRIAPTTITPDSSLDSFDIAIDPEFKCDGINEWYEN